jgi:hypothetical protein
MNMMSKAVMWLGKVKTSAAAAFQQEAGRNPYKKYNRQTIQKEDSFGICGR